MSSVTATGGVKPIRRRDGFIAVFWLHALFFTARHAPVVLRWTQSMWVEWGWRIVKFVRQNLLMNAARLLGPDSTFGQRCRLARRTMESFYLFVIESAECTGLPRERIVERIAAVENIEFYREARARHTGAILATAHMGSFEVALAALTRHEPKVHVVFQRDLFSRFNSMRSALRQRVGVVEHELEEGWPIWVRLREALARNEVVMMQADRALHGQKARVVAFMGGHIRVPTGPVRLAAISGAPIIPVFALRQPDGRIRIVVEQPILLDGTLPEPQRMDEALRRLIGQVERQVARHPEQWLMVQKVFVEDQESARK